MSATLKKILLLSLALLLSFTMVAFAGCNGLPQEEIDQIIAGAIDAQYDSFGFDMDMPMELEMKGGSDPQSMIVSMSGSGVTDIASEKLRMTANMGMEITGEGEQEIAAQIYVVDGWMYTGYETADTGEQWQKTAISQDIWQQQDMVGQQVGLLASATEIKYKGTDTVSGVECYVFEIEPDMAALTGVLSQEAMGLGLLDLSGLDIGELYKELSVKEWLAKDSYRVMRTEVAIVIEMGPEEVGATSDDFEKMTLDIGMTMRFYDYDQSFTIELPAAALDAEEITSPY